MENKGSANKMSDTHEVRSVGRFMFLNPASVPCPMGPFLGPVVSIVSIGEIALESRQASPRPTIRMADKVARKKFKSLVRLEHC